MLVAAVVIAVGAIAAFVLTTLSRDDTGTGSAERPAKVGKVDPASVKVGVLNGTGGAETGLAAEYADRLEKTGFRIQGTADAPTTFDESIVFYRKGREAQARSVGRSIDVGEFGLVTSDISDLVPDTTVTVVIGTDRADSGDTAG